MKIVIEWFSNLNYKEENSVKRNRHDNRGGFSYYTKLSTFLLLPETLYIALIRWTGLYEHPYPFQ